MSSIEDKERLLELEKQLDVLRKEEKADVAEVQKLLEELATLKERVKVSAEAELRNAEDNLRIFTQYAQIANDHAGTQELLLDVAEKKLNYEIEQLEALRDQAKAVGSITPELAAQIQAQERQVELAQDQANELEKQKEAYDSIESNIGNTVSGLIGSVDASKTFTGQLFLSMKHSGGISGTIKNIGKGLATALSPANVFAGLMAKVQEASFKAFLDIDQFRADLTRAGASLDQYNSLMENVSSANAAAGVSLKDTQQAILGLHSEMTDFNTMSAANQETLTNTTVALGKLGVSAQQQAQNLNTLTKSMGMNVAEANNATLEIAATANALGISQEKMASDFAAAAPQLVAFGSQGVDVFRELSVQAKATGVSVGELLGMTQQFDTFEGAAEAAGKLNAVLGTQINSIELLTANDAERIDILRESFEATGKSFDQLNKFERQSLAAAAGISDMSQAAKIFGTSSSDMEKFGNAASATAMANDELQKKAAAATTTSEKLGIVMEQFGVAMGPAVEAVHSLLNGFFALDEKLGGKLIPGLTIFVGILATMVAAFKSLTAARAAHGAIQEIASIRTRIQNGESRLSAILTKGQTKATEDLTKAQNESTKAQSKSMGGGFLNFMKELGEIASKNAKGFLALGAAFLMIGGGIAIAAFGMAEFVRAFSGMEPSQILAVSVALGVFMAGMAGLAFIMTTVGAAAVLPMLGFGAAFLMIGAGIGIAALGMSEFVKAFSEMEPAQILAVSVALGVFVAGMAGLALVMATAGTAAVLPMLAFGAAFLMIGTGVTLAAIGMSQFVKSFSQLDPSRVFSLGVGLTQIALAMGMLALSFAGFAALALFLPQLVLVFATLATGIAALAASLSLIKTDDLRAVADMALGIGAITIESAVAFGKAMMDTRETVEVIAREPESAIRLERISQVFAPAPTTATAAGTGTPAATPVNTDTGNREIVLKLDRAVLGRAVINIFEKEQNLNKLQ